MTSNTHPREQQPGKPGRHGPGGTEILPVKLDGTRIRWGVATRLLLAFCGVTLMTVLVAVVANSGLADARKTLVGSRDSFDRVSQLLDNATLSLYSMNDTINNAGSTLDHMVATMGETSNRVNNLNSVDLPAVIAIGVIREALAAISAGERTLLMRQLYDLDIRDEQRRVIATAFDRAYEAQARFATIESRLGEEKRQAWAEFIRSWRGWQDVHDRLMGEFDKVDALLRTRTRGGFEFEENFKRAFDLAFGEGQIARAEVNARLDQVVILISDSAQDSAKLASDNTRIATGEAIAAKDGMGNAASQIQTFTERMGTLNASVKETISATSASLANADQVRWWFVICSLLGFAVSIVLAIWQMRYLSQPIRKAADQMELLAQGISDQDIMHPYVRRSDEIGRLARSVGAMLEAQREIVAVAGRMASGDFSGSVKARSSQDRLGVALSEMMRITHDALTQVNRHVQQVTDGAGDISTVSQSLSVAAAQSATALVEISTSTTEIGEQTHRNAQNAAKANEFAQNSQDVAEKGYEAVEEMVASMAEIQTSSKQIAQIVKLIDDIAFQTNLLALNAAVEAARAGRMGKGFSVVAEEVRNLASRSAKAARETASLVEETVRRVENGSAIAMRTDEAFKEILVNAEQTTQLYAEIASASQDQSKSIDQIVSGLAQIDQSTQHTSRYASQTATAARTLSGQTGELRNMMVRFQLQHKPGQPPRLALDNGRPRIHLNAAVPPNRQRMLNLLEDK